MLRTAFLTSLCAMASLQDHPAGIAARRRDYCATPGLELTDRVAQGVAVTSRVDREANEKSGEQGNREDYDRYVSDQRDCRAPKEGPESRDESDCRHKRLPF